MRPPLEIQLALGLALLIGLAIGRVARRAGARREFRFNAAGTCSTPRETRWEAAGVGHERRREDREVEKAGV